MKTYKNAKEGGSFVLFVESQFMPFITETSRIGYFPSALSMCSIESGSLIITNLLPRKKDELCVTMNELYVSWLHLISMAPATIPVMYTQLHLKNYRTVKVSGWKNFRTVVL